jgi:hypothetical protein
MNLDDVLGLLAVLVFVAIIAAAWIGLTERGRKTDDRFRQRWGGSDSKVIDGE